MTLVVSDASPVIALHQLGVLDRLFGEIVIPPAVAREVTGIPLPAWIKTRSLQQAVARGILHASLGPGESEAIGLTQEIRADWLLLDDRPARRLAEALGLSVTGTLGLLLRAKEKGLLGAVRPHVEALVRAGFYASSDPRRDHPQRGRRGRGVMRGPRRPLATGFLIRGGSQLYRFEYDSRQRHEGNRGRQAGAV